MTTEEQLAFALSQAEFWRLRYLSAVNVTHKELEFVVRRVTATAVKEEREACAVAAKEFLQDGSGHGEFLGNLLAQRIRERSHDPR